MGIQRADCEVFTAKDKKVHEEKNHFSPKDGEKWGTLVFKSLSRRFEVEICEIHVAFCQDVNGKDDFPRRKF